MTEYKYKNRRLPPRERAEDLLHRMTVTEKVGQLNQRLYGFHAYEKTDDSHWQPSEEFCQEVKRYGGLGVLYGLYRADPWSGRTYETGLVGDEAIKVYNILQHYVVEHSRFGIPMLLSEESPHGHQALDGYLLPVNLAVGAAFDPDLVGRAAHVCGRQLSQRGVDLALVSMLDVLRDPRWGRSEECFGEDPYLASVLAESVTRGLHAEGVDVVAKHFAAQGETTGGVNASAARIGERELREIHLPPAEAAVTAGAAGIMAAYNEIDGIPCHANAWLLQDILRGEMGFDGVVMADGLAVDRLKFLGLTPAACGATALNAGVDISLWDNGFSQLEEALKCGLISEDRLDEAVLRVLTLKFERGLFEQPYLKPRAQLCSNSSMRCDMFPSPEEQCVTSSGSLSVASASAAEASAIAFGSSGSVLLNPDGFKDSANVENPSLELAKESVILLKNDGVLPLVRKKSGEIYSSSGAANALNDKCSDTVPLRVALIGERSRDIYAQLGDYTPPVRPETCWTIERGLRETMEKYPQIQLTSYPDEEAAIAAASNDVTILVAGGSSSRFGEVNFDKNGAAVVGAGTSNPEEKQQTVIEGNTLSSGNCKKKDSRKAALPFPMDCGEGVDVSALTLPEDQLLLTENVYASARGKVITVILAGRPYIMTDIAKETDALLYAFYPGPYGGRAIAELICGEAEPSGRLPASLPRSAGQLPVSYNPRISYEAMHYCDEKDGPLYPFGYGLGYGKADYSDFQVTDRDHLSRPSYSDPTMLPLCIRFTAANLTDQPVYAVPMLFIRRFGGTGGVIPRKIELKDFGKQYLLPGETRQFSFTLTVKKLSMWDRQMKYKLEGGHLVLEIRDGERHLWETVVSIGETAPPCEGIAR